MYSMRTEVVILESYSCSVGYRTRFYSTLESRTFCNALALANLSGTDQLHDILKGDSLSHVESCRALDTPSMMHATGS